MSKCVPNVMVIIHYPCIIIISDVCVQLYLEPRLEYEVEVKTPSRKDKMMVKGYKILGYRNPTLNKKMQVDI